MPEILTSKKFVVALAGIVVSVLVHTIPGVDEAALNEVIMVIVAYIIGQGIADHGKEAAKINLNG